MARKSMIASRFDNELRHMRAAHTYLRFAACDIDVGRIQHQLYADTLERLKVFEDETPEHVRATLCVEKRNEYHIIIPDLTRRFKPKHATGMQQLETFPTYFKHTYGDSRPVSDTSEGCELYTRYAAIGLKIQSKQELPVEWGYSMDWQKTFRKPNDGIPIVPESIGLEQYKALQPTVAHMINQIAAYKYAEQFGQIVSHLCTTAGITKRVWPECTNFLGYGLSHDINQAKASQIPKRLREQLRGYSHGIMRQEDRITKEYLDAQLELITNLTLQAQLIPTAQRQREDLEAEGAEAVVWEIHPVWLAPDPRIPAYNIEGVVM